MQDECTPALLVGRTIERIETNKENDEKAAAALVALSRLGGKAQKEDLDHQNGTPDEKPEERQTE